MALSSNYYINYYTFTISSHAFQFVSFAILTVSDLYLCFLFSLQGYKFIRDLDFHCIQPIYYCILNHFSKIKVEISLINSIFFSGTSILTLIPQVYNDHESLIFDNIIHFKFAPPSKFYVKPLSFFNFNFALGCWLSAQADPGHHKSSLFFLVQLIYAAIFISRIILQGLLKPIMQVWTSTEVGT